MEEFILGCARPLKMTDGFSPKDTQPFTIAFVYCQDGREYCVKGMMEEVESYIEENYPKSIYRITYWKDGKSRGSWRSPDASGIYVRRSWKNEHDDNSRYGYRVSFKTELGFESMFFRNFPKRWLRDYDDAIPRNVVRDRE